MSGPEELKQGLEGVLVAESSLSRIDGDAGELAYRGYAIEDLARQASYEEVIYLLWNGSLPDREELASYTEAMASQRALADGVERTVARLGAVDEQPMAAMRTIVSTLSAYDPDSDADPQDTAANLRKACRLVAKLPTALAAYSRARAGKDPIEPTEDLSHAANFLYMLNGTRPDQVLADTFDMALVLHADHGLNASTFTARVTCSTLADLHSGITAAVGALSGGLHGGANQDVMEMLKEVDSAEQDPLEWVTDALAEGRRIPGFGHRVYSVPDPRARILSERSKALGEAGEMKWYEMSRTIEEHLSAERALAPNVDFYSASTYYQMGIPIDTYTPIFALARVGGWIAHIFEMLEDNRLIRPRSRYVGPTDREFRPLAER